jgi:DNA-binding CsgD family transcriptional regulator
MPDNDSLSERELEILKLVATGASNKEIAYRLTISSNTVKVHLRNVFAKIGANSRTEAAMYAVRLGLVPMSSVMGDSQQALVGERDDRLHGIDFEASRRSRLLSVLIGIVSVGLILGLGAISVLLVRQTNERNTAEVLNNSDSSVIPERWQIITAMPTARYGFALANYDYKIYAISGQTESGISGVVERYDTINDKWEPLSSKPLPVRDISAAVVGGKIYVPGGQSSDGKVQSTLEIYDPDTDSWTTGKELPKAVSAYAWVAFEGKLYLFGGWDGEMFVSDAYEYLPEEDQWNKLEPLPEPRGFSGVAVSGGRIYIIGGYNGSTILANTTIYSPDKADGGETPWSEGIPLPDGRYAMGVAYLADTIYTIGGQTEKGLQRDPLQFAPQSDAWQAFDQPPKEVGASLGFVSIGNYLYVTGGQADGKPLSQSQSYQALYRVVLPLQIK